MTANPTASIANEISTIAAATESYLGFIDMIFGKDEDIAVEGKNRGDKNAEKAAKAYEKDGENPNQAKEDLKAGSTINDEKIKETTNVQKTVLKEKKVGEALKEMLQKIKEFFMSLFGKKIPTTAVVPFVTTEPNIDQMLNDILAAYDKLCNSASVDDWKSNYEVFKKAVQDFGTRLSKCREEIAAKKERYKEMKTKKVNIGNQLRSLEKLNRKDLKDVENLEAIQKELAKVYTNLARFYENPSVKKFLCFGHKDLSVDELNKKAAGKTGYTAATVRGNVEYGHKITQKNQQRVAKHNSNFATSDNG